MLIDKIIWVWLIDARRGLDPKPARLSPAQHKSITVIITQTRDAGKGCQLVDALRLRSKAYRANGVRYSSDAACLDLLRLVGSNPCATMPAKRATVAIGTRLPPKGRKLGV